MKFISTTCAPLRVANVPAFVPQLEYLLQDGRLTSAMQHLVAALEADIQRDYGRAEQVWTDVWAWTMP